jgi:hypothetical protein
MAVLLLHRAKAEVEAMTPEQRAAILRAQRESWGEPWARAEMSWPKPKYEWRNGVKVYASYEDYCNE